MDNPIDPDQCFAIILAATGRSMIYPGYIPILGQAAGEYGQRKQIWAGG
jgi:hypothetical protein